MSPILIKGATVVTMDPAVPDLAAGDILVRGERIEAVAARLQPPPDAEVIDAAGMIAMPGLINAHLHTWETALRGLAADWTIAQYMRAMHAGLATLFTPDDVYIANLMGALNQINSGTTTLVDWCHNNPTPEHTDAAMAGLMDAGIRAVFLHGSPKPDAKPGQKHFSEIPMPRAEIERLRKGRLSSDDALVTLGLAILGPAYSIYEVTREDMRLARELDMLASMHVGGGALRTPDGFERLAAEGLLGGRMNIVHGNSLADAQLKLLAQADVIFTVTADVELQMGFGDSLTGRLRALNSPVTIGPDVEPAVRSDMFTAMRTTLQAQRHIDNVRSLKAAGAAPETCTITCREALQWATVNGAKLLGAATRLGSLAPGKQADLVLLRASDLNLAPLHEPVNAIVAHAGPENVDTVMIAGRIVKRGGRLLVDGLECKRAALARSGERIWSEFQRRQA